MKLKFSKHFEELMVERGIDIDHVKLAMREPDQKKNVFENRMRVTKKIGKKVIEVIYLKEGFRDKKEEYLLITAYYL